MFDVTLIRPTLPALVIGLSLTGLQPRATAAEAPTETLWWCHYDGNVSVFCELVVGPPPKPQPVERHVSSASRHPSRKPLPPIVKVIAENPGTLLGTTIRIPLFSPPLDMDRVRQLADSVMCATNPSCRVEF